MIPIIVSTSDNYHHCLPIFFKQYNKFWGDPFTLIGHKKPEMELPENCTWVSMGVQRGVQYWSDDIISAFEKMPGKWFVWLFEDSFIRSFDKAGYYQLLTQCLPEVGRINLTREGMNRAHMIHGDYYIVHPDTNYRLSTQPSIWNKDFLFKYLTPGLNPWQFELQKTKDDFVILGLVNSPMKNNEGVRKHNIHKLDLTGIDD